MSKPIPRRQLNKERTRKAILRAAREGFAQHGVQGTTMDDIATAAEVSRTTLFNYFAGKGQILDHLVAEMHVRFFSRMEQCRAATDDVAERVMMAFSETGRIMETTAEGLRALVGYSELGWNEAGVVERMERLTASFERLLDNGAPEPGNGGPSRRVVAEIMTGIFTGMVHTWRISPDYPLESRLTEAARWIGLVLRSKADPGAANLRPQP